MGQAQGSQSPTGLLPANVDNGRIGRVHHRTNAHAVPLRGDVNVKTNKLIPCTSCGSMVRELAMASHWIIAGHVNPSAHAVSVRFPLDAKATAR